MRRRTAVLYAGALILAGCREGDGPADPSLTDARVYITSSPNGAQITVDNRNTGLVTPDTVALRRGDRAVALRLDSAGYTYEYGVTLQVERLDSVVDVHLPLGMQCLNTIGSCFSAARRHRTTGGLTFASSAVGSLFQWGGSGQGLLWPASTTNSYASAGMPVFAALADEVPVALGVYDQSMLAGLPAPRVTQTDGSFRLEQRAWVVPPPSGLVRPATVRGILIEEEVMGRDSVNGVLVVRLTFRNVSDDTLVHRYAPHIPAGAVTYTDAWIGFALDPDIGNASDDWLSYDVDLNMVFAYDSNFSESFVGPDAAAPGLLGLRVLDAPAGTSVLLNSWPTAGDWSAATATEQAGYGMLTGSEIYPPQHEHPQLGYMPPQSSDIRMSVTAGPLTLQPGDEARIVIAIAVAPPAGQTFTSGTTVPPGDPLDTDRAIHRIAANLRARMIAAEGLAGN
ncbi:MAG: PEGA domain-containing protein [Longimicrobiales bacterium]